MAKKKKSKREYDEDDDDVDNVDSPPQPKSDAYTGLVVITTFCLIAAGLLFYFDGDKFAATNPTNPIVAPGGLIAFQKN